MLSSLTAPRLLVAIVLLAWAVAPASAQESQDQLSVGDLFQQYSKSLVIVEGKEGRGSGSVLAIRGASFVVTNAHVLSQNPDVTFVTAGGKKIAVGSPAFAKDYDMGLPRFLGQRFWGDLV